MGHTPEGAGALVAVLQQQGFTDDELVDAGLARHASDGSLVDFLRHRVPFPIRTGRADRLCPVTPLGRELSAAQLYRLLELAPNPLVVAFDGDTAGRKAAARLAERITDRGRRAEPVLFPDGHDPAGWLAQHGPIGLDLVGLPPRPRASRPAATGHGTLVRGRAEAGARRRSSLRTAGVWHRGWRCDGERYRRGPT